MGVDSQGGGDVPYLILRAFIPGYDSGSSAFRLALRLFPSATTDLTVVLDARVPFFLLDAFSGAGSTLASGIPGRLLRIEVVATVVIFLEAILSYDVNTIFEKTRCCAHGVRILCAPK